MPQHPTVAGESNIPAAKLSTALEESATLSRGAISYVHQAAEHGLVRYSRPGSQAARCLVRRSGIPHRLGVALSARRLSRTLRYRNGARLALRRAAGAIGDPDHDRRHEFRRTLGQCQGSDRPGRNRHWHFDHHGRRRHDARGAAIE